jgi:hypothetical protein
MRQTWLKNSKRFPPTGKTIDTRSQLPFIKLSKDKQMGYLMRFISTSEQIITLASIRVALKQIDPAYNITNDEIPDLGDLLYGEVRCGIVEVNRPSEDIFEDDLEAFRDMLKGDTLAEEQVRQVLNAANAMVVVEAFWEGANSEEILQRIDPLWDWLFTHYTGISQADSEGFYDLFGLILERKYTI